MDPNDDGQSYARPGNPLYTTPKTPPRPKTILFNSLSALDNNGEDEEVALGTSVDDRMDNEISSDEEDSEDEDEENDMGNEEGYSLYRSRSKEAF